MPPQKKKGLDLGAMLTSVVEQLDDSKLSSFSYEPHEKQKEFHCSILQEKLFIGGNRSGKTVGNILECIWRITKTHPFRPELNEITGPIRGRLVCVSFVDGLQKIILPLFKAWIPKKFLIGRSWDKSYNNYLRTLTLVDGSFIEFMSYDQELEKFAGTSRHFVSFDEEPPKSVWEECLMRLVDTDGDWWISMTPVEGLTWVYEEIYRPWKDGERDWTLVLQVSMDDNPHLLDTAKARILRNMSNDADRAARKEGSFVEIKGLVYKTYDEHIHVRESFQLNDRMRIYTSLDTGWTHPAAWLWHAVSPSGHIVTFHEIVESERTVESLAKEVHEYERATLGPLGMETFVRTGDPAMLQTKEHTGTSIVGEYSKHDIFIGVEGVPKGPGSVDIGVIKMTQYLNTTVGGFPLWTCHGTPILARQMKQLRWEKYDSKKLEYKKAPKTTIDKKHDDAPDSLRYFITLMDDLTPDVVAGLQRNPDLVHSVPYSSPVVPPMPVYNQYSGSILYGIEG